MMRVLLVWIVTAAAYSQGFVTTHRGDGLAVSGDPAAGYGGVEAEVFFSALTPGLAGLYQINATMPAGVAKGDAAMVIEIFGQRSVAAPIAVE